MRVFQVHIVTTGRANRPGLPAHFAAAGSAAKSLNKTRRRNHVRATILTISALLSLLLPGVQAAQLGQLSTSSILASGTSLEGNFAGAIIETDGFADLSSLQVHGDFDGVIDVDESQLVVGQIFLTEAQTRQEPIQAQGANLTAVSSNEGMRILVKPVDALASISQLTATLLTKTTATDFETRSISRPPSSLPTGQTLEAHPVLGQLSMTGTFELMIYAANFTLERSGQSTSHQTGQQREPYAPASVPGTPSPAAATEREAVITVSGELKVQLSSNWQVYIQNPKLSAASGSFTLQQANGNIRGAGQLVQGQDVQVAGEVAYEPRIEGQAFSGQVTGRLSTLTIGGQAISLPSDEGSSVWWLWALGVLVAAAMSYGAYNVTATRGLQSLEKFLQQEKYQSAIKRATKLKWLPRASEDAVVVQAVAWLKLNRVSEAKAALATKPRGRDRVRPGRLYLRARIAGLEGNAVEAKEQLLNCLLLAPNYLVEALSDPILAPLVKDVQAEMAGGYA